MLYTDAQVDAKVEEAKDAAEEKIHGDLEAIADKLDHLIAEFIGDVKSNNDDPPTHIEIARQVDVLADFLRKNAAEPAPTDELRALRRIEEELRKGYSHLLDEAMSFDGQEVGHLLTKLDLIRAGASR